MTDVAIMYHKGCPDGFGGAWVTDRFLRSQSDLNTPELIPCSYGVEPPDVSGKIVYMVDFCYDELEWMKRIIEQSVGCVVLDHHRTGLPFLDGSFKLPDSVEISDNIEDHCGWGEIAKGTKMVVIDQNHSGAVMAGLFTGMLTSPTWYEGTDYEFLYYIEDRDLWKWELPRSREVTSAIDNYSYTVDEFDELVETSWHDLCDAGAAINTYKKIQVDIHVGYAQPVEIDGIKMLGAPASYSLGSDVAHELAKSSPSGIGVYWVDHPAWRKYGLRSLEGGPNVAEICARFGGGGHYHAAGFAVKSETIIIEVPDGDV